MFQPRAAVCPPATSARPPAAVQCALVARSRSRGSVTTVVASSLVFGIAALCVGCGDDAAEPTAASPGELIADPTSGSGDRFERVTERALVADR